MTDWITEIIALLQQDKIAVTRISATTMQIGNKSFHLISKNDQPVYNETSTILIHEDIFHTRKTQLISRIRSISGLNAHRIHGRKTSIQTVSKSMAATFINAHHLMGFGGGKTFLGLFYENELAGIAAFSKIRHMKYEQPPYHSVELERFCTKANTTIVGGLDKVIRYYMRHYPADDIITYIDKEWSEGTAYFKLGFELIGETPPLTFTVNSVNFSRQLRTNNKATLPNFYTVQNQGNLKLRKLTNRAWSGLEH